MERQFQINWPLVVEEARQRRLNQSLTQQQVSKLAGVSTPTVSRFENGEKDIQLSSVMAILKVLGMVDSRRLEFDETLRVTHDFDRNLVCFSGKDGQRVVMCAISKEALEGHFKEGGADLRERFYINRRHVFYEARRKYLANLLEPDGSVLIRTSDLV